MPEPVLSPNGAALHSQGCKPLEESGVDIRVKRWSLWVRCHRFGFQLVQIRSGLPIPLEVDGRPVEVRVIFPPDCEAAAAAAVDWIREAGYADVVAVPSEAQP